MTQENLADALNMDVSAIKRWELGTSTPSPAARPVLASALHITLEELAGLLSYENTETGIVHLSFAKDDRIYEYKRCLMDASGEILISGTSLLHLAEDSLSILAKKLTTERVKILIMDPDWISNNTSLLTFLPTENARERFRHEIEASLDRLSTLDRRNLEVRCYSTVFPYILTGSRGKDGRIVVEITDYIRSDTRPRFTLTPSSSGFGLFELVVQKFEELWGSDLVREVV